MHEEERGEERREKKGEEERKNRGVRGGKEVKRREDTENDRGKRKRKRSIGEERGGVEVLTYGNSSNSNVSRLSDSNSRSYG